MYIRIAITRDVGARISKSTSDSKRSRSVNVEPDQYSYGDDTSSRFEDCFYDSPFIRLPVYSRWPW